MGKMTNSVTIENYLQNWSECNDGLFFFVSQGQHVIEIVRYSGQHANDRTGEHGTQWLNVWEMYQVVTHGLIDASVDVCITELSQFPAEMQNLYKVIETQYYTDAHSAFACSSMLVAEHNHF